MRRNNVRILAAISSLALAALACQAVMGNGDPDVAPTDDVIENTLEPSDTDTPDTPLPTETEETVGSSDVLFEDDFSASRTEWGTGTDADSSVEYVDDALNIQLFTGNYVVWTYPNENEYENIHMEVIVTNNGSDPDAAFGFFCNKQYPIDDSRYYLAVSPNGEYAIAKAALAVDDEILTNNGQWETSDLITKDAASYRLGADCGNGTLTLYVDGQQIDSVSDSTYTSGGIALFVWSGEEVKTVNVSFDDFLMTQLP
jgi:hypothetical protein